jgi:hypothetical protein
VALDEHEVAAVFARRRVPEVIEADVVQHRRRCEARDVAADVRLLVARSTIAIAFQRTSGGSLLDVEVAGKLDLLLDRDRVDVRGVRGERQVGAGPPRLVDQRLDQELRAIRSFGREHAIERGEPLLRFLRIDVGTLSMQ